MTDTPATPPAPEAAVPAPPTIDPRVAWSFLRYTAGFWRGETALPAWALSLGLALCLILSVAITVQLNQWNRWFFDTLEKKDVAAMPRTILAFAAIIAVMAAIGVGIVYTREALQVRWRAWLIGKLVGQWLGERRYYELNVSRTEPANPEYRIADDTRWATEPLVDLGLGLVSAVFGAAAFISILWSVGGDLKLDLGGRPVTIPAYMVLVALSYGAVASILMLWVGRPLAAYFYGKNEAEGDFRFALMRLRDNAESVALMSGEQSERAILGGIYGRVVGQWMAIVRRHAHLTWITNSTGPMKPVIPLLCVAPKYFSGDLTLGQVTQLAAAFIEVQIAISWVVDNFNRIAEWYASARRVMDIVDACDAADVRRGEQAPTLAVEPDTQGLGLDLATLCDPFGAPLIGAAKLDVGAGRSLHLSGETSVGKTTLVRAMTGLWTRGEGRVRRPAGLRLMVLPQKPYMPLGTLADALAYPATAVRPTRDAMLDALEAAGLDHLGAHLDEKARWDQRLSNGERQRLGIARLLLHRPEAIVIDDALSALDETAQAEAYALIRRALPEAAIVTLAQTHPGAHLYDEALVLERRGGIAAVRRPEPRAVREKV